MSRFPGEWMSGFPVVWRGFPCACEPFRMCECPDMWACRNLGVRPSGYPATCPCDWLPKCPGFQASGGQ
eukprot:6495067-Alexandrium_andersonii.AAC.1